MQQDHISQPTRIQFHSETLVSFSTEEKDSVFCPCCGRSCYYNAFAIVANLAQARCIPGCGLTFVFRADTGVVKSSGRPSDASERLERLNRRMEGLAALSEAERGSDDAAVRSERPEASVDTGAESGEIASFLDNGAQSVEMEVSAVPETTYADSLGDTDIAERVEGFHRRKLLSLEIASKLLEQGNHEVGRPVADCSSDIALRRFLETGNVRVLRSNWCQKRIVCANCEKARSARTVRKWVPKILQAMMTADVVPMMWTLTVRNGPDLAERINHIFRGLQKFNQSRRDKLAGRVASESLAGSVQGAVWHLEIKRGKNSKVWHPHIHGLVLVNRGTLVDKYRLQEEWQKKVKDSFIADTRYTNFGLEMMAEQKTALELFEEYPELLLRDLCEVLKYNLKYDECRDPEDIIHAFHVCRGKRLGRSWGILRGLKEVDELLNEEIDDEFGAYLDMMLRFEDGRYKEERREYGHSVPVADDIPIEVPEAVKLKRQQAQEWYKRLKEQQL